MKTNNQQSKPVVLGGLTKTQQTTLRLIWPRTQATVKQLLANVADTQAYKVRVNSRDGETNFAINPDWNTGTATVPETVFPDMWAMTCVIAIVPGTAGGVAIVENGKVSTLRAQMIIPATSKSPALRLYKFAETTGDKKRALIVQVDKMRNCLVTEWSIVVIDPHQAQRKREATLVNEWLPLQDLAKTRAALPVTLAPLAETLCFLYDRACGKPMPTPAAPAAIQPAQTVAASAPVPVAEVTSTPAAAPAASS